ncbi:penicillin-binding protein 2 [Enterobacteriaceae endosymbiont of Neohaemonia nigricornis]|uniref:penicillin-binding protein 2 n=1 Tax=Enterobacteriaceae endosymbiont of Neohaemonia nigricornis TaxID=2675792 RepID=UPI00144A0596|nr:penicillin-binding protein 2 [Enterobacteriaceae endosymbiont of Neohaemonia nigricornis]QJC30484.1 penicillin-binding protein 2 [Enterobacteriaceae endosymbiont of Neohaemonia nigricornis]
MKWHSYLLKNAASKQKTLFYRIFIIINISVLLLLILLFNLYYLQIKSFNKYLIASQNNYTKLSRIIPHRGMIYDRNGIPLAINQTYYRIYAIPLRIKDINKTLIILKRLFPFNQNLNINLNKLITFIKDKKQSDKYTPIILLQELNEIQIAKFIINQHNLSGIYLQKYHKRLYPFKSLFAHLVGYVVQDNIKNNTYYQQYNESMENILNNISIVGRTGVEKYYDNILYGIPGYKKSVINNKGEIIYTKIVQKVLSGRDIYLTVDVKLQKYINSIISNYRIAIIISNPQNGDILTMISNPSFDPNIFMNIFDQKIFNRLLRNPNKPLLNRVIQGIYPPASTVKPYLALIGLKLGIININTIMYDPGWWKIPKNYKFYKDWKKQGHGYINLHHAIIESSDTFFYKLAYNMDIVQIYKWMSKFGFGHKTGIDLNNEQSGNLPNINWKKKFINNQWYIGDTISVGIGQGYWNTTPIQIHKALTILINNGITKKMHVLKYIDMKKDKYCFHSSNVNSVNGIPQEYWDIIKKGMYGVAHNKHGTIHPYFTAVKYTLAAKTGTAQVFSLKNKNVNNIQVMQEQLKDHKLIIAFAPYNNPKIAITIVIENNNNHDLLIGKLLRKIFDYIFQHYNGFEI